MLMKQVPYLFVLPFLAEGRVPRKQDIPPAFNHQAQFLINDAVKGIVHRHIGRANA